MYLFLNFTLKIWYLIKIYDLNNLFKYSIPKPVGGRKNNDLILREDELLMHGREYKIKD